MRSTAIWTSIVSLISMLVPVWADDWDQCICINGGGRAWYIANDRWCTSTQYAIDGKEFHDSCTSNPGAQGSCCRRTGGDHSDGCPEDLKNWPKRSLEAEAEAGLPGIAADVQGRSLHKRAFRDLPLSCINRFGTTYQLGAARFTLTMGTEFLTFALDSFVRNTGDSANILITIFDDLGRVFYERTVKFALSGVFNVPIPTGQKGPGVRFELK
ncbi:hypothetical protein Alg130_06214 [Pyrenophora tritici-repentis]|nr:hypothetical protein Alg130_06214 [Pyrenophora tritici-repentis]KAI0609980.1 hypothetical protein TUN205_05756 [Pyrenophora tritici-repentis]